MSDRIIYHKVINGRDIFRDLPDKIVVDGMAIYNPSQEQVDNATIEQINAGGWYIFVPPTPPEPEPYVPIPEDEPEIYAKIEAVKTMLQGSVKDLSDEDALAVAALFPTWHSKLNKDKPQQEGDYIALGERLWDDGELWKCITPHNALLNWRPKDSPSLFTTVSIAEWPPIPENIPSTNPWMAGRKGTWKGQHYICKMDDCVWNPDQYPAAWELVPQS